MPFIRSSRVLYSGCYLWYLVLWFSSCWSGVELRVIIIIIIIIIINCNWVVTRWQLLIYMNTNMKKKVTRKFKSGGLHETHVVATWKPQHQIPQALQTVHITLSSTPDQQLENHSTKYHRQQPLYNTLELLMMGIVVPETC